MTAIPTKVYPIPGRFAVGERMEVHELPSQSEAEDLVRRTGAFALSEKEANEAAWTTPEATPADDSNVKKPRDPDATPAAAPAPAAPEAPAESSSATPKEK